MMYFDIEERQWKQLSSLAPAADAGNCLCAETLGRQLFVVGYIVGVGYSTYCYDITNKWQKHDALSCGVIRSLCAVDDYMYAVPSDYSMILAFCKAIPLRWQGFAQLTTGPYQYCYYYTNGAAVLHSKLHVLNGARLSNSSRFYHAVLHCFDPIQRLICGSIKLQPVVLTLVLFCS